MTLNIPARTRLATFATVAAALFAAGGTASAQQPKTARGDVEKPRITGAALKELLATWPEKQRETAQMLITKYGEPAVAGDRLLVWYDTGPFVKTAVARDEAPHNFPMPHTDYLAQTVKHTVPADKLGELYEYDGSVWFHRTRGELTAQCDVEAMNFLALNLAHDVITGKRTVADARTFYAKTAMAFKQGDTSSEYVKGLIFKTEPNAADPDKPHEK